MSDEARIRALLEEGKITQEEAERLLAALQEIDEESVTENVEDADVENTEIEATETASTVEAISKDVPASSAKPRAWVEVNLSAGSLNVSVDPSLEEPTFFTKGHGEGSLERDGEDWRARFKSEGRSWFGSKSFSVTLRIPEGYGVGLDGRAGAVELNVPYLKGKMRAGTLQARRLNGLDFDMRAGPLELTLLLQEGEHRLDMRAGAALLTLLSGSSVKITGDGTAGGLGLPETFTRDNHVARASFAGTLGAGAATLALQQKVGSLVVRCE